MSIVDNMRSVKVDKDSPRVVQTSNSRAVSFFLSTPQWGSSLSQAFILICTHRCRGQPSSYSSNFLECMYWDRVSTELWAPLLDTLIGQWAAEVCLSLPPVSTLCPWLLGTEWQAISFTNGDPFSDSILFFFISFQSVTRTCLGGGVWNTFK